MTAIIQLLRSRTVLFALLLAVLSVVQGYVGLAISVIVTILCIVTFGRSRPGEAISAAAWDLERGGKWQGKLLVPVIDLIFRPWMTEHCRKSWVWQRHLYKKE